MQVAQWLFMGVLGFAGYLLRGQHLDAMQRIKDLETTANAQGQTIVALTTAAHATGATLARLEATAADILEKIDEIKDRLSHRGRDA